MPPVSRPCCRPAPAPAPSTLTAGIGRVRPGTAAARVLLLVLVALATPTCERAALVPSDGLPAWQRPAAVRVPGGWVNVAGAAFVVPRTDLSIDTRLGTFALGAVYSSASATWHWSHDMRWDGSEFVDETGARHATAGLAPGDPVPGTWWRVHAPGALRTEGGLVHEFGPDGRLAAVHWASAAWPRLVFVRGSDGALDRIDQCADASTCDLVFALSRDAAGHLAEVVDRAGRRADFAWDAQGRLCTARDGLDTARGWPGFRYEYADGRLSAITSSEDERVEIVHGPGTLEVTAVGPGMPTHRFRFGRLDGGVHRVTWTDPLGQVTSFEVDPERRLRALERVALGERTELFWDGLHLVERIEPDGRSRRWEWDAGRLVRAVGPGARDLRLAWQEGAVNRGDPRLPALRRAEDDLGVVEERSYDAAGRLVARSDGAGDVTALVWGPREELVQVTPPDGIATALGDYGEHGHARELARAGTLGHRRFDPVGNPLRRGESEPDLGGVVDRRYDEDRRLEQLSLSGLHVVDATPGDGVDVVRRSDGQPLRILRPGGADSEFVYDAFGRCSERRDRADGAWHTTRYTWDALGRLVARERPNGMWEEWSYDAAGRLVARRSGRGATTDGEVVFVHADGRLVRIEDAAHAAPERYAYDAWGRVARVDYPDGEYLVAAWDARDRLTGVTLYDPGAGLVLPLAFGWDGADRETRVASGDVDLVRRAWVAGRLDRIETGDGLVRRFAYDPDTGVVSGVETRAADGSLRESATLGSVCAVPCLEIRRSTFGSTPYTTGEAHLLGPLAALPGQDRAVPRVGAWERGDQGRSLVFDLDEAGRLREAVDGGETHRFVYGPEGQRLLRSEDGSGATLHAWAWDEAGFALERDGVPLAWDGAGRILQAGGTRFRWDGLGRPLAVTRDGVEQRLRFGGLVGYDAGGRPVALDLGPVRLDLVAGAHLYRHADVRGNTAFVTDAAGDVVAQYGYTPYGLDVLRGADVDPVRFARGQDLGEGWVRLGHRIFDSEARRFLAPDPVEPLLDGHVYGFGNPIWFWDPDGREGTLTGLTASQYAAVAGVVVAVAMANGNLQAATLFGVVAAGFHAISASGGFPWEGDKDILEAADFVLGRSPGAQPDSGVEGLGAGTWAMGPAPQSPGVSGPGSGLPGRSTSDYNFACAPLAIRSPQPSRRTLGVLLLVNAVLGAGVLVAGRAGRRE